jgi:hypothetical protein
MWSTSPKFRTAENVQYDDVTRCRCPGDSLATVLQPIAHPQSKLTTFRLQLYCADSQRRSTADSTNKTHHYEEFESPDHVIIIAHVDIA